MSTLKQINFNRDQENIGYFEELPKGTQAIVRDLLLEAAQDRSGPEGFKSDDECIEGIECKARDGFSPFSHNKGGLVYQNFAQHLDYWGGGYSLAHGKANVELSRLIDGTLEDVKTNFAERHAELLASKGIKPEDVSYHALEESDDAELKRLANEFSNDECESLSDENSTVMHELRFMYHGRDSKGLHTASVSAAVNLEAPYHRSHISWAPSVFCEGSKEVEITWRTQAELKNKLAHALKLTSGEVF